MARTRSHLQTMTIYTDGEAGFLTPDTLGGYWGQGDDPVQDLLDQYGEETKVIHTSERHMKAIERDWDDEAEFDYDGYVPGD